MQNVIKAEMDMLFGTGLDRVGEMIDLGVKCGLVKKAGSWFTMALKDGEPVSADVEGAETVMMGQGKEKVRAVDKWFVLGFLALLHTQALADR